MGSSITHLQTNCDEYYKLLIYVLNYQTKFQDRECLAEIWDRYSETFNYRDEKEHYDFKWAHFIHKIHPLKYVNKIMLTEKQFIDSSLKQFEFAKNIMNTSKDFTLYNYKGWKYQYVVFLKIIKYYPNTVICPSIFEDFMWHVHMNNHGKYVVDCKKIVGRIVGHDDSISDEKMIEYHRDRITCETYLKEHGYIQNIPTAFVGSVKLKYTNTGGTSGCGSACGSGCGGGDVVAKN